MEMPGPWPTGTVWPLLQGPCRSTMLSPGKGRGAWEGTWAVQAASARVLRDGVIAGRLVITKAAEVPPYIVDSLKSRLLQLCSLDQGEWDGSHGCRNILACTRSHCRSLFIILFTHWKQEQLLSRPLLQLYSFLLPWQRQASPSFMEQ